MAAAPRLFKYRFTAMASDSEVQIFASDAVAAKRLAFCAIDEVLRIERKYSRYVEAGMVSRINQAAGGAAVEVDAETASLLDYAHACHGQSKGLFDITSGVLRRVWNFREPRLPSDAELAEVLPLIGWQLVEWHRPLIRLPLVGMEIDFGGFGKEYAADRAIALLAEQDVRQALINLGGDVRVGGPQGDGSPWQIGIRHPRKREAIYSMIALSEGALATSGDYERYFEIDGRRYCHILDPRNGRPVGAFQSVSVAAPLCVVAGSCTTIAMLEGEEPDSHLARSKLPHLVMRADGSAFGTLARGAVEPKPATRA